MIVSAVITSYFVIGLKIFKDILKTESFYFELPFPYFRDSDENYWKGVKNKIIEVSNAETTDKVYVTCQDEFLLKTKIFDGVSRISDTLSGSNFPIIYLGETKGSVKGVVSPFIINPSDFFRWFYLAENINQVENYFYNRRAYGVKKPSGNWEEGFEESLFREKISFVFENEKQDFFNSTSDLILTGEGTLFAGDVRRVTLSFLDGCKVEGFWRIYLDRNTCILNIQNIGFYDLELSRQLFEKLTIEDLAGCLVVPSAKELEMKTMDGQNLKITLKENSISVIPFDKENLVDVKVKYDKKSKFIKVSGGDLGLVIDNRERPLLTDKNAKQRIALIDKWMEEISSKYDFDEKLKNNNPLNVKTEDKILKSNKVSDTEPTINKNTKNSDNPILIKDLHDSVSKLREEKRL